MSEERDKKKQSHIQIPRFVLKRFANDQGFLAYYDINKSILGTKGTPKTMNTEENYYSDIGERYWNSEVESELSALIKKLDKGDTDTPRSTLPGDFYLLSIKYLHSLMARSPRTHRTVENKSVFLQFLNPSNQHDLTSSGVYSIAQEKKYFGEWIPTLLVNKSTVPFILPMCGYVEYELMGIEGFISMPIDPKKAIMLIPPTARSMYCEKDHIKYGQIEIDSIAKRINVFAFETQVQYDYGYVFSNDPNVLREAKETYFNNCGAR